MVSSHIQCVYEGQSACRMLFICLCAHTYGRSNPYIIVCDNINACRMLLNSAQISFSSFAVGIYYSASTPLSVFPGLIYAPLSIYIFDTGTQ